jgi:hypothetical protein
MDLITKEELKSLIEKGKSPCISIFMPTHQFETQEDPIRLKNLLGEAEKRLIIGGLRDHDAKEFLKPARELLQKDFFRQNLSDGLAIFISSAGFDYYRFPLNFKELVVVNKRFYIKPLLPMLSGDGQFYVLAISQDEVRLLHGTHYSVSEIELKGVPESLVKALNYDKTERNMYFHSGAAGGSGTRGGVFHGTGLKGGVGKQSAMFHGHGGADDDNKKNILNYFRQIDEGLHKFLQAERVPLVLAGVDYLFPIYKEANTYPHLIDKGVAGNPEELSVKELHEQAWAILQSYFHKAQEDAVDQYKQLANSKQASKDIKEIVIAAYSDRVKFLFVAADLHQWGTFNSDTNTVTIDQEQTPDNEDLLDLASAQTIINGGNVYVVEPDKAPDNSPLAAVFRY